MELPRNQQSNDWRNDAACKQSDPQLFFGSFGERQSKRVKREKIACQICHHCPVLLDCLNDTIMNGDSIGVWGGFGEDELAAIRLNHSKANIARTAIIQLLQITT